MSLLDQLVLQNQHWENSYIISEFHRDLFSTLQDNMKNKFIITLIGPRRVGKTTLLHQLINSLLREGVDTKKILYFSLDLFNKPLLDVYNAFIKEMNLPRNGSYYLFFDEIQYLNNWASHVKMLYDNLPRCKIVISGSSASDLRRGMESLAGREIELTLDPLSFKEYLEMNSKKGVSETILWEYYLKYMDYQLPELNHKSISERQYISQLVDKIINYDFVRLHQIRDTTPIDTIFRIICKSPGDVIIINDLSKELNLDRRTVQHYLQILEKSLLIRKVYNYSKNPRKSEKRHKKYYPYYTSLHWHVSPYKPEFGKKVETEVAFQLSAEYYWNDRGREIDFIIGDEYNIGVEVKMRNVISQKHVRGLINNTFTKEKYLITKHGSDIQLIEKFVKVLPLHRLKELKIFNTSN